MYSGELGRILIIDSADDFVAPGIFYDITTNEAGTIGIKDDKDRFIPLLMLQCFGIDWESEEK